MKKLGTLLVLGIMALSSILIINQPKTIKASTVNYLVTNKNYYQDTTISKGYLDKVISDGSDGNEKTTDADLLNSLKEAANHGLVNYTVGMTFNEYFLANNISPEDNFTTANGVKITIPGTTELYNSHRRTMGTNPITYVGPATNRGLAYWGENVVSTPTLFSRLTVGQLPSGSEEGKLSLFNRDEYLMPNRIGYGEVATVNDYMLTEENNFVIPVRFNTSRDDVYLTMREHQFFGAGIANPRAFLSATINGNAVQSKAQNPNAYINLTGNVYITGVGYDQLGNFGKLAVASEFSEQSKALIHDIGVNEFNPKMNELLRLVEVSGPSQLAPIGSGGQIQLNGFYRQSDIDNEFTEMVPGRESDSTTNIDVKYYMYTEKTTGITTPLASNGKHLYSPNEATYKLEVTRPYFTEFGDLATPVVYDEATFEQDLGVNSFIVIDNGKLANGNDVGVDVTRVRARIDAGAGYTTAEYTLDKLKAELNKPEYYGKTVQVAYTYAGTDAQDEILGKLPVEIANDKGAYAVPFVRSVKVIQPTGKLQIVKVDADNTDIKLDNVTFIVKDATGTNVATLITDISGIATTDSLPLGEYTIIETATKEGYEFLTQEIRATLSTKDETVQVEIKNKKKEVVTDQDKPTDQNKPTDQDKPTKPVKQDVDTSDSTNAVLFVVLLVGSLYIFKKTYFSK